MKTPTLIILFGLLPLTVVSADVLKIGVMPKLTGIDYFNAVERGAQAAAADLHVNLVYDGPVTNDVAKQSALVETWIAQRFDAICVAPNDPAAISPVLRKAKARGIKVLTFDTDAAHASRHVFVNQASSTAIAETLLDSVAHEVGPTARYLILTGSLTAANQTIWMKEMEKYRQRVYPQMKNLSPTPKVTEEDQALATQVTIDSLKAYPEVQAIFALTTVALPGAAEGLVKAGAQGKVFLTGLSTPKSMRPYVKSGVVRSFVLWNPEALGYLTVQAAAQLVRNKSDELSASIFAGKLGHKSVQNGEILLGDPLVFTSANIDDYDF